MAESKQVSPSKSPPEEGLGKFDVFQKARNVIFAQEIGELQLVDRKMFNYLLARVVRTLREDVGGAVHKVPVADVLGYLGHNSTDRLNESLERLSSVEMKIQYEDNAGVLNHAVVHYLSYNMAKTVDGWVHFAFDAVLVNFIQSPKVFGTLSLSKFRQFKSSYAAKLYERMALYINRYSAEWVVGVEEFKLDMNVCERYPRYDNLRSRVIDPAVAEVNDIAPFDVRFEDIRAGKGGRVTHLRFHARPKSEATLAVLSQSTSVSGGVRTKGRKRDPHTIDMLTSKTDAEKDPLELSHKTLTEGSMLLAGEKANIEWYVEQWREQYRGRRPQKPDSAFIRWLEIRLENERERQSLTVEQDTVTSIVSLWEENEL